MINNVEIKQLPLKSNLSAGDYMPVQAPVFEYAKKINVGSLAQWLYNYINPLILDNIITSFTFNPATKNLTLIAKDGVVHEVTLPMANVAQDGFISSGDLQSLYNALQRITVLEGRGIIWPTSTAFDGSEAQSILTALLQSIAGRAPLDQDQLFSTSTNHKWIYFDSVGQWNYFQGGESVATNSTLGIVKGDPSTIGKMYVEGDGTMSLNGWDALNAQLNEYAPIAIFTDFTEAQNFSVSNPQYLVLVQQSQQAGVPDVSSDGLFVRESQGGVGSWKNINELNLISEPTFSGSFLRAYNASTNFGSWQQLKNVTNIVRANNNFLLTTDILNVTVGGTTDVISTNFSNLPVEYNTYSDITGYIVKDNAGTVGVVTGVYSPGVMTVTTLSTAGISYKTLPVNNPNGFNWNYDLFTLSGGVTTYNLNTNLNDLIEKPYTIVNKNSTAITLTNLFTGYNSANFMLDPNDSITFVPNKILSISNSVVYANLTEWNVFKEWLPISITQANSGDYFSGTCLYNRKQKKMRVNAAYARTSNSGSGTAICYATNIDSQKGGIDSFAFSNWFVPLVPKILNNSDPAVAQQAAATAIDFSVSGAGTGFMLTHESSANFPPNGVTFIIDYEFIFETV